MTIDWNAEVQSRKDVMLERLMELLIFLFSEILFFVPFCQLDNLFAEFLQLAGFFGQFIKEGK